MDDSDAGGVVFGLVVAAILGIGALIYSAASCDLKWKDSGRRTSWGLIQGCLVSDEKGHMVPEANVREFNR